MAKIIVELPTQSCSLSTVGASFHSTPKVCRAPYVANIPPFLYSDGGRGFRWKETRRGKQKDERPGNCFYCCSSSAVIAKIPPFCVISCRKGEWYGSSQAFGGVGCREESSLKIVRRKEIRSSSISAISQNEDEGLTQDVQEAVARVLLEAGLSLEDAEDVVSKAPVYIREVAKFVAKLETDSMAAGGEDGVSTVVRPDFDMRERIYELVKQSRGMSPLLESLGVNLPTISRISPTLSSQRLPDLLSKVRYFEELVKDIETSDRPVGGLVEVMVKNLTISVWEDGDLQRTLSFYEKIKHQGDGMGALEKAKSALPLFIEAFPQIFNQTLENEIKPTIRFLEDLGIKGANLRKVILCFPPILLQDPERDLVPRKRILKKVGIRVEDMGRMAVKYPWLLSKGVGANVDKLVQFLESIKVPSLAGLLLFGYIDAKGTSHKWLRIEKQKAWTGYCPESRAAAS